MENVNSVPVIGAVPPVAERLEAFNGELNALLAKHGFHIGAEPHIEEGAIKARVVVAERATVAEGAGGVEKKEAGAGA